VEHSNSNSLNSNNPLISFIITAFNEPAEMICECVESILTLPLERSEREVIVVDDGSTIPVSIFLKDYRDEITIIWQNNQGLSQARNVGMKLATGIYIEFVDADDYLVGSGIMPCIEIIKAKSPDLLKFQFTRTADFHLQPRESTQSFETGSQYMMECNIQASAWGYIFKKETAKNIWFTPNLLHEDEEFTPRLLLASKETLLTNQIAYFYRQRKTSITNEKSLAERRFCDYLTIMEKHKLYLSNLEGNRHEALHRRISQMTMDYLWNVLSVTKNPSMFMMEINQLKTKGFLPIPIKLYTWKYALFAFIVRFLPKKKVHPSEA